MDKLVFVYGTLKADFSNHGVLGNSRFMGTAKIKGWELRDLGAFPAITPMPDGIVHGEMYVVTDEVLKDLDCLEGYPSFYDRKLTKTDIGWNVWVYFHETSNAPVIESGRWEKTKHLI